MTESSTNARAIELASRQISPSVLEVELAIPDIHCAGCISTIENALLDTPSVDYARVNLTTRRVRVRWHSEVEAPSLIDIIERSGFKAFIPEPGVMDVGSSDLRKHILALAVAGFAAGNVMMLSLSVWSGADEQTRHLFHWLSAAIALPALLFSSRIFFVSAWQALRVGRTNMDVPICVGIVMTAALSVYDTLNGGQQVYFDAAIMLVFLLLIGRTLETRMRAKVRSAVDDLATLQPAFAQSVPSDNQDRVVTIAVSQVLCGDTLQINKDERIPVDCRVVSGTSSIDNSLVTGESAPVRVSEGELLYSGCLNLEGDLRVVATETVNESFLARIEQQISDAHAQKGRHQQMVDRVISYYTPFVHLAALLGFGIWIWLTGDWHRAVTVGVTVLIITCPCALGLAVPIARVIASHQLLKSGVLVKNGAALERLGLVSRVIFDKTGTLTSNHTQLRIDASQFNKQTLAVAQSLCVGAQHPYAKTLARFQPTQAVVSEHRFAWQEWCEIPGEGLIALCGNDTYRFGRADWACEDSQHASIASDDNASLSHSILTKNGENLAVFSFENSINTDALDSIRHLQRQGLAIEILSGDTIGPVQQVANELNITLFEADAKPADKLERVQRYQANTDPHILMVGDGINDSPALAAASVSMVPGTGADMTRKMADFVLLGNHLTAVPQAIDMAQRTRRIVAQNLALAVGYNVIALPLAITGVVTPLIAAVAMSVSSVLVISNSLRLASKGHARSTIPFRHTLQTVVT